MKHPYISSFIGFILILSSGVFIVLAFNPNFAKGYELNKRLSVSKFKLLFEERKNFYLKREFDGLSNNPEYIEKAAREKLGWCRPVETIYRFQTQPKPFPEEKSVAETKIQ